MNTLEIKFYDNKELQIKKDSRLIENGGDLFRHEIKTHYNSFNEFYIDGISLITLFIKDGNHLNFLQSFNGALGVYGKFFDEIFIYALLKKKINAEMIDEIFKKHNRKIKSIHREQVINDYLEEINEKKPLMYRCICGDYGCGGIAIDVEKHEDYYLWSQKNELGIKLQFKFGKEAYERLLKGYLKDWKSANSN